MAKMIFFLVYQEITDSSMCSEFREGHMKGPENQKRLNCSKVRYLQTIASDTKVVHVGATRNFLYRI